MPLLWSCRDLDLGPKGRLEPTEPRQLGDLNVTLATRAWAKGPVVVKTLSPSSSQPSWTLEMSNRPRCPAEYPSLGPSALSVLADRSCTAQGEHLADICTARHTPV